MDRKRKAKALRDLSGALDAKSAPGAAGDDADNIDPRTKPISDLDIETECLRRLDVEAISIVVRDLTMLCRRAAAKLGGHDIKEQIESYVVTVIPHYWSRL